MATAEGNVEAETKMGTGPTLPSGSGRPPRPPKKRRIEPEDDEIQVFGGRYLIAAALVAIASIVPLSQLGQYLEPKGPEPTRVENWKVGVVDNVRITLVTADYQRLTCASEQSFDGVHCAFKTPTEPWPREPNALPDDNKLNIIQPYRTWFDNKLVFVSGLWAQPEVAFRTHREPALGQQPDKLARFAVECRLRFVGRLDTVKVRWDPSQSWGDPDAAAWVGKAEYCKLIDEPQ